MGGSVLPAHPGYPRSPGLSVFTQLSSFCCFDFDGENKKVLVKNASFHNEKLFLAVRGNYRNLIELFAFNSFMRFVLLGVAEQAFFIRKLSQGKNPSVEIS